jgi:hypothetical protein
MRGSAEAVLVLVLLALSGLLYAQTRLDYSQVARAPEFGSGLMTTQRVPSGPQRVQLVDLSSMREYVVPTGEPQIVPGPCRIGTGAHMASNTAVKTPTSLYLCIPDGTGQGFRWARVQISTAW